MPDIEYHYSDAYGLELVLSDPRGSVARRERLALGEMGFETFDYTPSDAAPSGTWNAQLYLIGKDGRIQDSVLADLRIGAHEAFVANAIKSGAGK